MNDTEIKVNEMLTEAVDRLIGKYKKKADKEREQAEQKYIVYKGDKYCTRNDIMDAYACDMISSSVCDRLLERLDKAKQGLLNSSFTESEMIVLELHKYRDNLANDLIADKKNKEKQKQIADRMAELSGQGYSYREAETIVGNELLMEQA